MLRYKQSSQNRKPVVTQGDLEGHIQMNDLEVMMRISGGMLFICGVGCLLEWLLN